MTKKKVAIRLPIQAQTVEQDWSWELEALAPIADIVEVHADTPAEFAKGAHDADALMTSWGMRIGAEIIGALENCAVIGVGSVGVDMVDVEAATKAGIVVTNVPDVFIEEVADHAMMLLLDVARMARQMARMASQDEWHNGRPVLSVRPRLLGQTLGFYGFGNVARCTARRAKAFGLHLLAYDPYVSELEITGAGVEPVGFKELLERSDFISIHTPHNSETEHAFDAAALAQMKPTAILINTARGPIIDEPALIAALRDGVIAGAGLDVLEQNLRRRTNPLLTMDNAVVTPHVASAIGAGCGQRPAPAGRAQQVAMSPRGPLADELCQPECAASRTTRQVAALPDESRSQPMNVARAIAKAMKAEGVDILFAYPVNPLIEAAAEEDIRTIIVRQERTGLHMADAYSRVTSGDKFGVFCMQHGPGSENAFGGVAQAFGESVPILIVPSGYPRRLRRNYYPNFNSSLNMRNITKWAEPLTMAEAIPEVMRRVFSQLRNGGRPGPVLLEVPCPDLVGSRGSRYLDPYPDLHREKWSGPRVGRGGRAGARRRRATGDLRRSGRPLVQSLGRVEGSRHRLEHPGHHLDRG